MNKLEEINIDKAAEQVASELLPAKSRKIYEKQYQSFLKWCNEKNVEVYSENALLVYFNEKSKVFRSSTLWSHYSMLKAMLNNNHDIDISKFTKLISFLKRKNDDYKPKKSKILTSEQVDMFLTKAPDNEYLMTKVNNIGKLN
jgi:hypothetical protein